MQLQTVLNVAAHQLAQEAQSVLQLPSRSSNTQGIGNVPLVPQLAPLQQLEHMAQPTTQLPGSSTATAQFPSFS